MNKYQVLLDLVKDDIPILTAGKIHDDIPTIHDIGHNLITDIPVIHCGFGLFRSKVNDKNIYFDAGGAMIRLKDSDDNTIVSYTKLDASESQLKSLGYDINKVKSALESFNE